ncbi:MAG: integrin alpha [Pseudomonadota bacterium]|jgi:hypothetical protein
MFNGALEIICSALKISVMAGARSAFVILAIGCFGNITAAFGQNNFKVIHRISGTTESEQLGHSVAGIGDVNGDGFSDFVVGARGATNPSGKANAGGAKVYSGSDGSVLHTFWGDDIGDGLGFSVSGIGDVDGDGVPDLVVGIPFSDINGADAGAVRVFSGKDGTLVRQFVGSRSAEYLGLSVAAAGDLNKDQVQEIVVGAPGASNGGPLNAGAVIVFSVKDGKELWTKYGSETNEYLGEAVAGVGDLNKDGYDDVIAGTTQSDDKGDSLGSVTVFSGQDGKVLNFTTGSQDYERFGRSVAGLGDLNGDGYKDFAVGATGAAHNGEANVGRVTVFSGAGFGILATLHGSSSFEYFGSALASAGDMNGDGINDIVVGSDSPEASVRIFSGKDGAVLYIVEREGIDSRFGSSLAGAGDVNGDGYGDVIIGVPESNTAGDWSGRAVVIGDSCPDDPAKAEPGICGCGTADTDTDNDGTPDCNDQCTTDPNKTRPGLCGCGTADTDTDKDGIPDCSDQCLVDPNKAKPGQCGCGVADTDTDRDGTADCNDKCPNDPLRIGECSNPGISDSTPTPTPAPTPNLLEAPRVKVAKGSAEVWVVGKFSTKDRVTFRITGPVNRSVRGQRIVVSKKKGTARFQTRFSKLPKGSYQVSWQVLWAGATSQQSSARTFNVK